MIALPVLIPLFSMLLLLLSRNNRVNRVIGVSGAALVLISSLYIFITVEGKGIQVMNVGSWPAPIGIPLVIDMFSAIMLVMAGIISFCVSIYASYSIDEKRQSFYFFLFFHAVILGVNGSFITGDIFNFFVWFEVMLIGSFCLLILGNKKRQLEGAIKYITLSLISSFFFVAAIGLIYGETGTLNMADLARIINEENSSKLNTSAMLFFVAFGIKAAIFPFFYWLPASYHTPPVAVTAFFAGLLSKVGVYALIRFFTLFFVYDNDFWHPLMLIAAGTTMLFGVLMAASQNDIRRILSFHIISQIGYMVMGLGIFTPLGIAGAIYFIFHNVIAKSNAFLVGGIINHLKGSYKLKNIYGLYQERPLVAFLFFIPAMALAGLPPLSGFFGKYLLIKAGIDSQEYIITVVALVVSIITLFSMIKIWGKAFWEHDDNSLPSGKKVIHPALIIPTVVLASISISLGLGAEYFINIASIAAEQLLNSSHYIDAVLGKPAP
ncbi:MAG: proton-conducting transporter transmembrane domain-containing protein [Candidatus Cyclobacteriaceae bacterium M2_1C_046]